MDLKVHCHQYLSNHVYSQHNTISIKSGILQSEQKEQDLQFSKKK